MNDSIFHVHLRNGKSVAYRVVERDAHWATCFDPVETEGHSPDLIARTIPAHEIKYIDQIEVTDIEVESLDELEGYDD